MLREMAGKGGRVRLYRPTISAAKCWASEADPPLPAIRILLPDEKDWEIIFEKRTILEASIEDKRFINDNALLFIILFVLTLNFFYLNWHYLEAGDTKMPMVNFHAARYYNSNTFQF